MDVNAEGYLHKLVGQLLLYRKRIFYAGVAAMVLGVVIGFWKPKEYTAETSFVLKNYLFADRSYLYSKDMRYINYYAPEDDIERLVALIDADSVMDVLIKDLNLVGYYKIDTLGNAKALRVLKKNIADRVKIYQTPQKNAVLAYKDNNADTAAVIANYYLGLIEKTLRKNYNSIRQDVYFSLQNKIKEEDSLLAMLTDSLAQMRNYYGIYDIINPTRGNMILNMQIENNGHPEFAKGLELVQNIESVKDRMVADRSDHLSLANQYSNDEELDDLSLIQVIKVAQAPLKPTSLGVVSLGIFCGILGAAFAGFFILLQIRFSNKRL